MHECVCVSVCVLECVCAYVCVCACVRVCVGGCGVVFRKGVALGHLPRKKEFEGEQKTPPDQLFSHNSSLKLNLV